MAYADQKMSSGRITAIVIVGILHALLGYAFVTGLAYNVIKQVKEDLKTFDVTEPPPPPDEPPPPPPDQPQVQPPPVVSPPPIVRTQIVTPQIQTVRVAPPVVITPTAPPAPPAPVAPPPAPRIEPAKARANLASYVSDADYPAAAIRNEEEGVTGFRLSVGANGRVTDCAITASSGSSSLDATTCRLMRARARFTPATDSSGKPTADVHNSRIRWVLPDDR